MQPFQLFNIENIFYFIFRFFQRLGLVDQVDGRLIFTGQHYIYIIKLILIFFSVFLTFLIIDFLHRLMIMRREQAATEMEQILKNIPSEDNKNEKWGRVMLLLDSENESDLKLAVIEADKMLDELLIILGYEGESLGDRLISVEKGDMQTLDDAWEAHKCRNRIAHETGFQLTQHEARRVIGLYARVFNEYKFI